MRKLLAAVLGALALIAATPALAEIKIGFMAPMSGPAAAIGQDMYDAFMLGIAHSGGRLGGQDVKILLEDDQIKPDLGVQLAQKLIEKEQVPIIAGVAFSNVMMAVYKPIVDAEVFLIGTLAGPSPIAGKMCSPYFFSTSWQTDQLFEGPGKYASGKYKRMVIMGPNYVAGKDALAGFKRYYEGEIIDEVYTPLTQLDYSAEIAQLHLKKPDAVFVFYPGAMGVNFVKQYNQSGLLATTPLLSASTVEGTNLPALKSLAVGVLSAAQWAPDFDNPVSKRFVEDFEKKHNRIPSNFAAQAYDAALLLDSAIRKVNGKVADKDAFRAALKAAEFESTRGPFRYNHNHFPIQDFYVLDVVMDGKGRATLATHEKVFTDHVDAYHQECPMK